MLLVSEYLTAPTFLNPGFMSWNNLSLKSLHYHSCGWILFPPRTLTASEFMFSVRPLSTLFRKPLIPTFPRKEIIIHSILMKILKPRFTKEIFLRSQNENREAPDILKAIGGRACYVTLITRLLLWKWQRRSYNGEALSWPPVLRGEKTRPPKLLQGLNKLTVIISEFTWIGTVESKSRMLTMAPRFPRDELTSCATSSVLTERSFRYVGSFSSWEGLLLKA